MASLESMDEPYTLETMYREAILQHLREKGPLDRVPVDFWDDKEIMMEMVRYRGSDLRVTSDILRLDRDLVLAAVRNDGEALQYATAYLDDREVVKEAVSSNGKALMYTKLLDRELAFLAAGTWGHIVHWGGERFFDDEEICLRAVSADGSMLKFCSTRLRGTPSIVRAAVTENGRSIEYASPELQRDREVGFLAGLSGVDLSDLLDTEALVRNARNDWCALQATNLLRSRKGRFVPVEALVLDYLLEPSVRSNDRYLAELLKYKSINEFDFLGKGLPLEDLFELLDLGEGEDTQELVKDLFESSVFVPDDSLEAGALLLDGSVFSGNSLVDESEVDLGSFSTSLSELPWCMPCTPPEVNLQKPRGRMAAC